MGIMAQSYWGYTHTRSRLRVWVGLALLEMMAATFSQPAHANIVGDNAYVLNQSRSKITFSIGHFLVSSTEGKFANFDGKLTFEPGAPERGSVIVHVDTNSISTGITARDEHLRTADFFDVAKFPSATFQSTDLTKSSNTTGTLTGQLSLHGVTRPITLNVTLHTPDLNADRLDFSIVGLLKRSDYGMNNFEGMIGDEVSLDIEAEFDRGH